MSGNKERITDITICPSCKLKMKAWNLNSGWAGVVLNIDIKQVKRYGMLNPDIFTYDDLVNLQSVTCYICKTTFEDRSFMLSIAEYCRRNEKRVR